MRVVYQILKENLPVTCEIAEPTGGYFIWIKFPENIDITAFNAYSKKHHLVSAIAGNDFSAVNSFKNYQRISIAFYSLDKLRTAVQGLCKAYSDFSALN